MRPEKSIIRFWPKAKRLASAPEGRRSTAGTGGGASLIERDVAPSLRMLSPNVTTRQPYRWQALPDAQPVEAWTSRLVSLFGYAGRPRKARGRKERGSGESDDDDLPDFTEAPAQHVVQEGAGQPFFIDVPIPGSLSGIVDARPKSRGSPATPGRVTLAYPDRPPSPADFLWFACMLVFIVSGVAFWCGRGAPAAAVRGAPAAAAARVPPGGTVRRTRRIAAAEVDYGSRAPALSARPAGMWGAHPMDDEYTAAGQAARKPLDRRPLPSQDGSDPDSLTSEEFDKLESDGDRGDARWQRHEPRRLKREGAVL